MCKKMKRVRQVIEVAAAILGLIAAVMYFIEIRQNMNSEE